MMSERVVLTRQSQSNDLSYHCWGFRKSCVYVTVYWGGGVKRLDPRRDTAVFLSALPTGQVKPFQRPSAVAPTGNISDTFP